MKINICWTLEGDDLYRTYGGIYQYPNTIPPTTTCRSGKDVLTEMIHSSLLCLDLWSRSHITGKVSFYKSDRSNNRLEFAF